MHSSLSSSSVGDWEEWRDALEDVMVPSSSSTSAAAVAAAATESPSDKTSKVSSTIINAIRYAMKMSNGGEEASDEEAYRLVTEEKSDPEVELSLGDRQADRSLQHDIEYWAPRSKMRDYYDNATILQYDREAEETPLDPNDPLLDAVPSPELSQAVFNAVMSTTTPWRHLTSSFNRGIVDKYRYIRRSKCFIDLIDRNNPPWTGMEEAEALLKDESPPPPPPADLANFVVKKGNYIKAYNMWYDYHLQRLNKVAKLQQALLRLPPGLERTHHKAELETLLQEKADVFQYVQYTVEVHYDNLRVYPPGCGPSYANLQAGASLAWDGNASMQGEGNGTPGGGSNSTVGGGGGGANTPGTTSGLDPSTAARQRMTTAEECMAKGEDLRAPIWCTVHRFLVQRIITMTWSPEGIRKHEHVVRPIKRIYEHRWPRGEEVFCGFYRELTGSLNCPSIPALLDNPVRRAQLDVYSTPYRREEILYPGGFQLSSLGAPYVPTMYLSPVQHKVIICKSRNQMPMLIVHFVNYMTGSMDNVMLRIEQPKSVVYKRDEAPQSTTVLKKNKTIIGTSGQHSVVGFATQDCTLRPDRQIDVDIPVLVAAANKYAPGHGNALGLDESYQGDRIRASMHHYMNYRREQVGLPPITNTEHPEYDTRHPYEHEAPLLQELELKKSDESRIAKMERLIYENPQCSNILIIEPHIQRTMVRIPVVSILYAAGRKDDEIRAMIGHGDEQYDDDDAIDAANNEDSYEVLRERDPTMTAHEWNLAEERKWQEVRRKVRHTSLYEKRRRYDEIVNNSLAMFSSIPESERQDEMIHYLGELYCVNIQNDMRVKTVREYGEYFLEQCFLPMQGLLEQMKEDAKSDQPINVAIGNSGHFMGSHAMKNVIFDERTKFVLWKKSFSMCTYMIHPLLRVMSGFRGQQYGRLYSQDEYQCNDIVDINNYHFRVAWRLIRDMYLKDIKSNLNALTVPAQWWFTPSRAYQRQLQDVVAETVRDVTSGGVMGSTAVPTTTTTTSTTVSSTTNAAESGELVGDVYMQAAREEALAAATAAALSGSVAAANSAAAAAGTDAARRLYQPAFLKKVLVRTFQDTDPITKFLCKTTTKSEEDARRPGSIVKKPYNPFNLAAHWSLVRQVVALSNPHAGSRSREFQSGFEYLLDVYGTSTNDSSGQNNEMAAAATCSRNLTQAEHLEMHDFVKRLIRSGLLWAARDFYRQRVAPQTDERQSIMVAGTGGLQGLLNSSNTSTQDYYLFMYGSDWLGLVHKDDVPMMEHRLFMFQTHPNRSDGIRMLSIQVNHAQRFIAIHFNRRLMRLTWVLEGKRLRAARVSLKFRRMMLMQRHDLRPGEWLNDIELMEELWSRRCIQFRGYDDTRDGRVGNSFAMLLENRKQKKEPPFLALEIHPSANLGFLSCARPFIDHDGGARALAAHAMSKSSNQPALRYWPSIGKQNPGFTLVQPQKQLLQTSSPLVNETLDGCHAYVAFYNSPTIHNDASRNSKIQADFGGMMIMITEVIRSVQDMIREKATRTLGEMETQRQWTPTQIQKKQREMELIRKTQQQCLEQTRQMPQLQFAANAATAIFDSHDQQRRTTQDLVRQHQNLTQNAAAAMYVANDVIPTNAGSAALSVYQSGLGTSPPHTSSSSGAGRTGANAPLASTAAITTATARWTTAGTKKNHTTYLLEQDDLLESGELNDSLQTPTGLNEQRETLIVPQMRISKAPTLTWEMFCQAPAGHKFTIEYDVYIDMTNTVSMPAFLQPNHTLIRAVTLNSALVDAYAARDAVRTENERMKQSMVMRLNRELDARILKPVPDLPPVNYDNVVFKSKRLPMELLGFFGTWDDRGRVRLHFPMALMHHESIGDKETDDGGQKTTVSEETKPENSVVAATRECAGMVPARSLHTAAFPTRKTMSNHIKIVCGSVAAMLPSHQFLSTESSYRRAPSMFNDHLSQSDLRASEAVELNAHYIEALEARKNATRFGGIVGEILQRWTVAACTRQRSPLRRFLHDLFTSTLTTTPILTSGGSAAMLWTCDAFSVEQLENSIVRCMTAAMSHIARQWSSVEGAFQLTEQILQAPYVSNMAHELEDKNACQAALAHIFDAAEVRTMIEKRYEWNAGVIFRSLDTALLNEQVSLGDQLRVRWWHAVWNETWRTMRIGDVFWAPLAHTLHQIRRDWVLMELAREDMLRLADTMTADLCRRVDLERPDGSTLMSNHSALAAAAVPSLSAGSFHVDSIVPPTVANGFLETTPQTLPATFAANSEALSKYRLMIVDQAQMISLELVRLFPLVQRLDHVLKLMQTHCDVYQKQINMESWDRFVHVVRSLADSIRAFSNHIQLETQPHQLSYDEVARYIRETQLIRLHDDQAEHHALCRVQYPLEEDANEGPVFFTVENYQPWLTFTNTVEVCTSTEVFGEDDYGLNLDLTQQHNSEQYGQMPLGALQHIRQYCMQQFANIVCHSLLAETMHLPIQLWSLPQRTDRPIGGVHTSWSTPDASMVAVAHHREAVKSTEWPALVQALHHHYPAFHTVPSLAPELMRLSHRLLNTNAESEEEKQIESILARAVDMELENLTLPQTELAFNGETGEQIFIFIGPTHLWSLPKIATDLMKSRSTGPVHFLSGQPAATSDGQGAGRWGRMELQALAAAGAAGIIQTTTSSHSDHFVADLCEHCGLNYAYNHVENTGYCANCKRTATGQHKTVRSSQISTEALRIAGMHRIPVIRRSDPDKEEHLNA